jgi:predicted DNA-binding transcriptional regulator YafY
VDNGDELCIRLSVYLAHDFLMELLSYGETVKVLAPQGLVEELQEQYRTALNRY